MFVVTGNLFNRSAMESGNTIFFAPYALLNPYQERLAASLADCGFQVVGNEQFFFLPDLIRWKACIIHFHWPELFYAGRNGWRSSIKLAVTFGQLLTLRLLGVRIVWTVHNLRSHEGAYPRLEGILSSYLVRHADRIFVHCDWAKREFSQCYPKFDPKNIVVTHHASYMGSYPDEVTSDAARLRFGIRDDQVVFLFLGAVRGYKGVLDLLAAFTAADLGDAAVLIIAGKPLDQALARQIESTVEHEENVQLVLQFISDEEVQYYMGAADVFVLPYRHIVSSGAVMLAMSFAKAIVAPRLGCLQELLDHDGAFLYQQSEPNGLSRSLARAVTEKEKLAQMGRHNLKVARGLTWDGMAERTANAYRECIDGSG